MYTVISKRKITSEIQQTGILKVYSGSQRVNLLYRLMVNKMTVKTNIILWLFVIELINIKIMVTIKCFCIVWNISANTDSQCLLSIKSARSFVVTNNIHYNWIHFQPIRDLHSCNFVWSFPLVNIYSIRKINELIGKNFSYTYKFIHY